jgi:hypothetical protein
MNITKLFVYQKPYTDYILATILALAFLLFALQSEYNEILTFNSPKR